MQEAGEKTGSSKKKEKKKEKKKDAGKGGLSCPGFTSLGSDGRQVFGPGLLRVLGSG